MEVSGGRKAFVRSSSIWRCQVGGCSPILALQRRCRKNEGCHTHKWTPSDGPQATPEYRDALIRANLPFSAHHRDMPRKSAISEKSGVREHKGLCDGLDLMACIDQINLKVSFKAESDIRRLIGISTAVKRNPKQPDFEGLEVIMAQTIDDSGSLLPRQFDSWFASRKKDDAQFLKQYRLWQEEMTALNKKMPGSSKDRPPQP